VTRHTTPAEKLEGSGGDGVHLPKRIVPPSVGTRPRRSGMDLNDCIQFATTYPICFLGTEDGDQARVRTLLLWFADERGFHFMTMSPKGFSRQLHDNPNVEVCFYNGATELPEARQMRVTGRVEFVDDSELTHKVAEERAALEGIIGRPLEPITEVFRIAHGQAHFWTLMDILREPGLERIVF
jgi:pyridoxamine 5'-phosphate oxidase